MYNNKALESVHLLISELEMGHERLVLYILSIRRREQKCVDALCKCCNAQPMLHMKHFSVGRWVSKTPRHWFSCNYLLHVSTVSTSQNAAHLLQQNK